MARRGSIYQTVMFLIHRFKLTRSISQRFGGLYLRYFPGQITCAEFESFLYDYHENRLSDDQCELFERHMRLCPMCRTSLASYIKTVDLSKKVFADEVKQSTFTGAPRELINAIIDVNRRRGKPI